MSQACCDSSLEHVRCAPMLAAAFWVLCDALLPHASAPLSEAAHFHTAHVACWPPCSTEHHTRSLVRLGRSLVFFCSFCVFLFFSRRAARVTTSLCFFLFFLVLLIPGGRMFKHICFEKNRPPGIRKTSNKSKKPLGRLSISRSASSEDAKHFFFVSTAFQLQVDKCVIVIVFELDTGGGAHRAR